MEGKFHNFIQNQFGTNSVDIAPKLVCEKNDHIKTGQLIWKKSFEFLKTDLLDVILENNSF